MNETITMNERKHIAIGAIVNVHKAELKKIGYSDFEHWASQKDHLYIGRNMSFYIPGAVESIWHNPYAVMKNNNKNNKNKCKKYTLDESLEKYREHVLNSDLVNRLHELDGKILGCWCKPDRCHGDILRELVESHCND